MFSTESLKEFLYRQLPGGLDLLRQMVNINSFTANREGVNDLARLTAESFAPLGFVPEFVPAANPAWGDHLVLTRPGSSGRSVALISHLDTVFPPEEEKRNGFCWQPEGDRIYGPGTHDIKGGTLMMWLVLSALQAEAPATFDAVSWKLFWNAAEECFSPDFREVCQRRFDGQTLAALVFEAEGRSPAGSLLVVARKGRFTWRVSAHGRGAHAGSNHGRGVNAIVQLAHSLQRVAALTDYSRRVTFNVGTVTGGTVLNRVPHLAQAEGECRAFTPAACAEAKAALASLAGRGEVRSPEDDYAAQVQVEILTESSPWPENRGTRGLFECWQAAAGQLGLAVGAQQRGGLSDGNLLWDLVPTLDGLGPWGENDHCSERSADGSKVPEYVQASSFVPKAILNVVALQRLIHGAAE